MTGKEFRTALAHQTRVLDEIEKLLHKNKMSLSASDDEIWLCDDGRDIGNTGY